MKPKKGSKSVNNDAIKILIIDYTSRLSTKYPDFTKASRKCNAPHFNRDVLTEDLFELISEYSHLPPEEVLKNLDIVNKSYKKGLYGFDSSRLLASCENKCKTYGLWLFCQSRTIDRVYYKKVLKKQSK